MLLFVLLNLCLSCLKSCGDLRKDSARTLSALAAACNQSWAQGCRGFNTNGYLKACVRNSCGASIQHLDGHPELVSCLRSDTPSIQPPPPGCQPTPPRPSPPGPPQPSYNCSVTANRPECNCSGQQWPFDPPAKAPPLLDDHHFPTEEPEEAAGLITPTLQQVVNSTTVVVIVGPNNQTVTATVGGSSADGWALLHADPAPNTGQPQAVLEYTFNRWRETVFLVPEAPTVARVRRPIGRLDKIVQPQYQLSEVDVDWGCKQVTRSLCLIPDANNDF